VFKQKGDQALKNNGQKVPKHLYNKFQQLNVNQVNFGYQQKQKPVRVPEPEPRDKRKVAPRFASPAPQYVVQPQVQGQGSQGGQMFQRPMESQNHPPPQ
jgi:hypothetical protein